MIGRRFFLWLFGAASVAAPAAARADGYGAAFAARGPFPYMMVHLGFEPNEGCGKPAFLLRCRPGRGSEARSADAAHLDGRPMEFGARTMCDSCGKPVYLDSTHVRENL